MSRDGRRADRVAGLLRRHLTDLLRELGDERLATIVVTDVAVTDDLSVATLSVRALAELADEKAQRGLLKALSQASGRLRRGLAPRLELRKLPELRFRYDLGHDNVRRVDELLHEIAKEGPAVEPESKD
ncbi:MAG: 30S ribosome-binding factor RbfA [Myxococcales bacterium]|nr:30S ribosome-binding factor RbfA [Myxococcales bacterium]